MKTEVTQKENLQMIVKRIYHLLNALIYSNTLSLPADKIVLKAIFNDVRVLQNNFVEKDLSEAIGTFKNHQLLIDKNAKLFILIDKLCESIQSYLIYRKEKSSKVNDLFPNSISYEDEVKLINRFGQFSIAGKAQFDAGTIELAPEPQPRIESLFSSGGKFQQVENQFAFNAQLSMGKKRQHENQEDECVHEDHSPRIKRSR